MYRQSIRRFTDRPSRRGSIVVLSLFLLVGVVGIVALALDIGYLYVARTELQRTADAAAISGCWDLITDQKASSDYDASDDIAACRTRIVEMAALNPVCSSGPSIPRNDANVETGELVLGRLANVNDGSAAMDYSEPAKYNAVRVRICRSNDYNGQVPFFFAKVFGYTGEELTATATAAFQANFGGWRMPSDGGNLELLPFALDVDTWNAMLAGGGTDLWKWNPGTKTIVSGADGIREVNLYPQGTGSPGNRGTVDIGSSGNSTADLARQIMEGVNAQDMEYHDGELAFGDDGTLPLNGDTGISAGVKDELAAIQGKPKIIPIFSQVAGPGNNATYTIVKFAGVRVMDVKLTGPMSGKRVIIQPAAISSRGGIPSTTPGQSYFIYSPVTIVQ